MTATLARALRALADRLSPPSPTTIIYPHVSLDGREIARAVARATGGGEARR